MYDRILIRRTQFFSQKKRSFTITKFVTFQPNGQTPQSSKLQGRRVDENLLSSCDLAVPPEVFSFVLTYRSIQQLIATIRCLVRREFANPLSLHYPCSIFLAQAAS